MLFRIFHTLFRRRADRIIGKTQGSEVKHRCLIDHGKIDLLKAQSRIRSRLSRKAEGTVTFRRKSHKCQCRKHGRICQDPLCLNSGFLKRLYQQFTKSVIPDFSEKCRLHSIFI